MLLSKRFFDLTYYLLICLGFISVLYLIYISNKGIDLSDEIYNMQGFIDPDGLKYSQTYFHLFIVKILPFIDYNIVSVRLLRLLLILIATFYLSLSFYKFLKPEDVFYKKRLFFFLFFFLLNGNLLAYSSAYQVLSYNSLSSILIQFILAGYFFIQGDLKANKLRTGFAFIHFFLIFFFSYGLFLTKFPSASITFILIGLIALNIFIYKLTLKQKIYYFVLQIVAITTSFIFFIVIVFGNLADFLEWKNNFVETIVNLNGRSLTYLFSRYKESIVNYYDSFLDSYFEILFLFFASIYFVVFYLKNVAQTVSLIIICILFFVFLYSNKFSFAGSLYSLTQTYWLISWALFALFLVIRKKINFQFDKLNETLILFFLFFIPIIASIGTNNWLTSQVIVYPLFWFLFFFYFFYLLASDSITSFHSKSPLFLFICVLSCVQLFYGTYMYPYRIHGTIDSQKHRFFSQTDKTWIYIHEKELNTLDSTRILLNKTNFKIGDPFFCYFEESGIPYLLGAKSITYSSATDYDNAFTNCFLIEKYSKSVNMSEAFVLLPKFKNDSIITISCLKKHGIDINNMIKLGEIYHTMNDDKLPIEIYSPKSRIKK